MLRALLVLIVSSSLFAGCDPAKVLIVKAGKKKNTSVTIYTNRNMIPFRRQDDDSKMIIHVPFNDSTSKSFYYGLGGWSDGAITDLAADIDSIIIVNIADRLALKDKTALESYLKNHCGGFAKSVLKIKAK